MSESPDDVPAVRLGPRFSEAVAFAADRHAQQLRKGTDIPYVSHPLAVAAIVLEGGGDEDEAIAALLHDVPEDQGGRAVLEEIQRRFGERVAGIVEGCSDTFEKPKPDWRPRKESYVAHLRVASKSVLRVAAADKVHNLESLLFDIRKDGARAFDRFKTSTRNDQVWFHKACADALVAGENSVLTRRVADAAEQLEKAVERLDAQEA